MPHPHQWHLNADGRAPLPAPAPEELPRVGAPAPMVPQHHFQLPPHVLHHPAPMGGIQQHIPGVMTNAPWVPQPYGAPQFRPPYPLFHPHYAQGAGFGVPPLPPWGYNYPQVPHPLPHISPVPEPVATVQNTAPNEGNTASTTTGVLQKRKYPNNKTDDGGELHI